MERPQIRRSDVLALTVLCGVMVASASEVAAQETPPRVQATTGLDAQPAAESEARLAAVPAEATGCEIDARSTEECVAAGCVDWRSSATSPVHCCARGRVWLTEACGAPALAETSQTGEADEAPVRACGQLGLGTRVGFELLGFYVGVLIPGVPLLLWALAGGLDSLDAEFGFSVFIPLGAALVALFTAPLGIQVAGDAAGGSGGYGWTFLGTLLGAATIVGALFSAGLVPAFSGILGYELSSDPPCAASAATRSSLVLPTLEVSRDRAVLGIGGSF
jgi:hypothetical protein